MYNTWGWTERAMKHSMKDKMYVLNLRQDIKDIKDIKSF